MAKKSKDKGSKIWSVMALATGVGASRLSSKALGTGWKAATGRKPPANPADPDVALWESIAWAAVTGATVALVKMLAQRRAANYYVKSTGALPPQLAKDGK